MDLSKRTGLSKEDFKKVIKNLKQDRSKFFYENAVNAVRKEKDIVLSEPNISAKITKNGKVALLEVSCENCFGVQPFLALKTVCGQYYWQNFDFTQHKNKFLFTFDINTFDIKVIETIGIACNSDSGVAEILLIYPQENYRQEVHKYNN